MIAAEKVTGKVLDASDHKRLISEAVSDLDLSRLEEQVSPSSCIVDLSTLVSEEVTVSADRGSATNVRFSTNVESGITVRGNGTQLVLLVRNLVDNAVRYMPKGGTVTISLETIGPWVELLVADTGIGIPLKDQKRVFERFYRVDGSRARSVGGTGLGLSIVKHVVELHGGEIELQSVLDRGSRFKVRLPRNQQRVVPVRRETA